MADKRISQLVERTDIANNDVVPIVASGATTTNKATISSIQTFMQENLDVGVTSVGITLGSSGTDVSVTGSPITTSGNITINIPDASDTARGVVNTGSQTFGGLKTFANGLLLPSAGGTNQSSRFVNTGVIHIGSGGSNIFGFNNSNNIYFGKGLDNGGVIQWNNAAVRYYTLQDADGTLAFTSQLDGYVTLDTAQTITAQKVFNTSGSSDSVIITHGSGSGIALDVIKAGNGEAIRVTKTSGTGNAVTISGGDFEAGPAKFGGTVRPTTNMIADLGSGSIRWSTLFGRNIDLTEGAIIGGALIGTSASFSNVVSITASPGGAAINLRGRTIDDASQILFFSNNGTTLQNYITSFPSSLAINSQGNTPITFGTNLAGGGGTRMTISGTGAVTLTGALNGTSASFTGRARFEGTGFDTLGSAEIMLANTTASTGRSFIVNSSNAGEFLISDVSAGQTRLSINNLGAVTLTGALNGTSASFTGGFELNTTGTGALGFFGANNTTDKYIRIRNSSGNFEMGTSSSEHYLLGNGGIPLKFYTNGSPSLTLASTGAATFSSSVTAANLNSTGTSNFATTSGNVAIGTADATTAKVEIRGIRSASKNELLTLSKFDFGATRFFQNYSSTFYTNGKSLEVEVEGLPLLQLATNNAGSAGRVVFPNGNVGIGTASPGQKLTVNGNVLLNASDSKLYFSQINNIDRSAIIQTELGGENNHSLLFFTNPSFGLPTERMRITSGGFLKASNTGSYIGVSNNWHEFSNSNGGNVTLYLRSHGSVNGSGILSITPLADTSEYFFGGNSDGVARVRIYTNGNIVNVNNSYGSLSDIKLKENIEDATPKLDDLMKVKVRNYKLIGDDKKQIGVIAQELEEVFPAMIDESEDFEEVEVPQLDEEGNEVLNEEGEVVTEKQRVSKGTSTKSVKYSVFVPMLIKAIQELKTEIDSLKNQIK